ncbi:hypothetical protein M9Y10_036166 [Tritrichomonas musculus]|uniref:Uncharacterized protein n=1 Tax=Tritrichomonas musculus TaxID=1915356 RepID=A0ABR2GUM6_9EUKA
MEKDIEKQCLSFRSYIRMLRKGINDTCYLFQNDGLQLSNFMEIFPQIDETFALMFNANNAISNERIDAIDFFYEKVFPLLDPTEVVNKIKPEIDEAYKILHNKLDSLDMTTFDEKKKKLFSDRKKKIERLQEPFQVDEIIDIKKFIKQMSECFNPPMVIDLSDIMEVYDKYVAVFKIYKSFNDLKNFNRPAKITPEQALIKRLYEQLNILQNTIEEKNEQISKLQQEKMTFKRENIQLKKENESLQQQNDELVKRVTQMNNRLQNNSKMVVALEKISGILEAPAPYTGDSK